MKAELESISISQNNVYVFNKNTSAHHLIEFIVKKIGKCDIFISSFSMTEPAIRTFINLYDDDLINSLTCLFDTQVKRFHIHNLFLLSNFTPEIYIRPNHSKVFLFKNEEHTISIVTSSNLNVNNKIEAGSIFVDIDTYNILYNKFLSLLDVAIKLDQDDF